MQNYKILKKTNISNGKSYRRFYARLKNSITGKDELISVDKLLAQLSDKDVKDTVGIEGATKAKHHVTTIREATRIVDRAFECHLIGYDKEADPIFIDYLYLYWDYDNSPYITLRNADPQNKTTIGRDYASNRTGNITNHIAPNLPKDLRVSQLTPSHIRKLQEKLVLTKSKEIWLSVLKTIRPAIKQLEKEDKVFVNLFKSLENFKSSSTSTVGSLTRKETAQFLNQCRQDALFGYDVPIPWGKDGKGHVLYCKDENGNLETTKKYLDKRVYLGFVLACATGLRRGEIDALKIDAIEYDDEDEDHATLNINASYGKKDGFKTTKTKRGRVVPIDMWLAKELEALYTTNPWNNGYIFYSDTEEDKPLDLSVFTKTFNKQLARIGIDEEQRIARHLTLHSCRHYANSEMRTLLGDEKTRQIMGHVSASMTEQYDSEDKHKRILKYAKELIGLVPTLKTEDKKEGNV